MNIFSQPLHYVLDVIKSIFLRSKAVLNSKFSFFLTGCLTTVKEPGLAHYIPIAVEKRLIHAFLKGITVKWNANSVVQDSTNSIHYDNNHYAKRASLLNVNA